MKKIITLTALLCSAFFYAQVGINTTTPTEMLHVDGNLRIDGALMPGGNAGNENQLLITKGAGNEPEWGLQIDNIEQIQGIAKYFAGLSITSPYNNNTTRIWAINAPGVRLESNVNVSFTGFHGEGFIITNVATDTDMIYVSIRNQTGSNYTSGSFAVSLMVFY